MKFKSVLQRLPQYTSVFCLTILSTGVANSQSDDYEKRIFEIYQKYQSQPISDESWQTQFGELKEDIYEIQKGDTLWDVSKIFFGDGYYWSKLWSVNEKITNPHEISPQMKLRFIRSYGEDAPSLQIVAEEQSMWQGSSTASDGSENLAQVTTSEQSIADIDVEPTPYKGTPKFLLPGAPPIPRPQNSTVPVVKKLPGSLRGTLPSASVNFDQHGFSFEPRPEIQNDAVVTLNSYLDDQTPEAVGEVLENEGDNETVGQFQYTYIKLNTRAELGEKFTVVRDLGPFKVNGRKPRLIEVLGQVSVSDFVQEKENHYRAFVLKSVNPLPRGAILLRDPLPNVTYDQKGDPKNVVASIVGGMGIRDQRMFGLGHVVYLDRGRSDGLSDGDILGVSSQRVTRLKDPQISKSPDYIALLKVVKTSNTVATALVVQEYDEVLVGDVTGLTVKKKDIKAPDADEEDVLGAEESL